MWNTARSKVQHSPLSAFSHTIAMLSDIRFSYWVKGEEISKSRSPWMTSDEFCILLVHDMYSSLFYDLASFPRHIRPFPSIVLVRYQSSNRNERVTLQSIHSQTEDEDRERGGLRGGPAFTRCSERSADPAEWGSGRRGRKAGAGGERGGLVKKEEEEEDEEGGSWAYQCAAAVTRESGFSEWRERGGKRRLSQISLHTLPVF